MDDEQPQPSQRPSVPVRYDLERLRTPHGILLLVTDEADMLRALEWQEHESRLLRLFRACGSAARVRARRTPSEARRRVQAYLDGELNAIDAIRVKADGTPFQCQLWAALRDIPAGQTLSYSALAQRLERPRAVRAVGLAAGANPIAIVVPCHRVIGADGALVGYAAGLERKRWLLEHEGVRLGRAVARRAIAVGNASYELPGFES